MIDRALLIATFTLTVLLAISTAYYKIQNKSLGEEVIACENEKARLEQLLKVKPFEAVVIDRKERANDEINSTIHSGDSINDGVYRL